MTATPSVGVRVHEGWATLTISNPSQRNALTPAMLSDLRRALEDLSHVGVRAVILRGADGTFSSGFALDSIPSPDDLAEVDEIEQLCRAIEATPMVVVAVIEGVCVGAALDLACACDLRFAVESARLGITPAKLGLVYSLHGTQRIQRVAGRDVARRLFFSGDLVSAGSDVGRRLVSHLSAHSAALVHAAHDFVARVAANAPGSIAGAKRIFHALDRSESVGDDVAAEVHRSRQAALASADCAEALVAFSERRAPRFVGP